jgi:hypothetical protein
MPRRDPLMIVAATRLARAREIVANQRALITKLRAQGQPTEDAEKSHGNPTRLSLVTVGPETIDSFQSVSRFKPRRPLTAKTGVRVPRERQ